ncbi:MAG: VanW family protein [Clostridia bacterium]|nr:VanW family protein [Clostridia bacterium]
MDLEEEKQREEIVSEEQPVETTPVQEEKTEEQQPEEALKENESVEETTEEEKEETKEVETVEPEKAEEPVTEGQEKEQVENNQEENQNDSKYKVVGKTKTKKNAIIITIIALVLIVGLLSTVFALVNVGNTNIIDGVKVKGIEIVGLSKEDAKLEIEETIKSELEKNVILKYEEYETTISPEQIEATYNIDKAVEDAYNIGRSGNILQNNYEILSAMLFGKEIELEFAYNDKALTDILNDISKKMPGGMKDNSYYIEGDKLIITSGKPGIAVNDEIMKKAIIDQIKNPVKNFLEISIVNVVPGEVNIDKIYQEVKRDPKDAYYTENPFTIHPSEDGIDFAISLEEARNITAEKKEEYEIPLKFIAPAVTTSQIGTEAFPNLITKFSTRYDAGLVNRSTNLKLASDKINGTVLMPGEEFSYNKVVGERTIAAGYKDAPIYSGGKVVDGLGGGICQISSTLYDAVVQANLEIVERSNHQFVTSYIDAGKDATVVYGYIDFKFKNTRNYPIKIESSVGGGIAEMKIYGVLEETEYDIKLETEKVSSIPFSVQYIDDNTLEAGQEIVEQNGHAGQKTVTYKVCRLNGEVVSKTVLSNDTYSAMTKIIRRGTKNVQPVKTTSPEQTQKEITTPSTPTTVPEKTTTETTPKQTETTTKTNSSTTSKTTSETKKTNTTSNKAN